MSTPTPPPQTQQQIIGTDTVPEGDHEPHLCKCGQYHSNFTSPNSIRFRYEYHKILSSGSNMMELMFNSMQFMKYAQTTDPMAFDELMQDDMRRKQLNVEEVKIEVTLDHTTITPEGLAPGGAIEQAMGAVNTVATTLQPQIEAGWNKISEELDSSCVVTQQEEENIVMGQVEQEDVLVVEEDA